MPALPETSSDRVAFPSSNTDPTSKQSSAVGSFSASYPHHPSRNVKPRDSLDIEPIDEAEKRIWRSVRQELHRMLDSAREDLEKEINADPDHQSALRKQHEEKTVVEFCRMAQEHYLAELAREREERSWLSGQSPSPSLVKQQHGIMNRIQSSTSGATSSNTSASTSGATSSTVHNADTHTKSSSSSSVDASESLPRSDSRSSMSKPLPSFTQRPYPIPPLPPQLEAAAARRTSHGSAGPNNRDESLGNATAHDTHYARNPVFEDELQRPSSTSTSSLRSKASLNEFPAVPGPNGASPTKPSGFERSRTSSDRHFAASPPGSKPVDEFWTPFFPPEEDAAAKQLRPVNRRGSDASMRSMSSVTSGKHPPAETIPARAEKPKDREFHERKNKDFFSAPTFGSVNRSPSSISPAPGVSSSYSKPRFFDDSGMREREYSDPSVPHIPAQYLTRPHQNGIDEWVEYTPSASRKSSRPTDPGLSYESYPYSPQGAYQGPAIRPTVVRSGSYSRSYSNHDMHDDLHRPYPSHSQSIPVPHRSPKPNTMASSVDQSEGFTGQSPGWRDWKYHQPPTAEDYAGAFKSPSRNSFEARYSANSSKMVDEPDEQPEHTAWRRRSEQRLRDMQRAEVAAREDELQRQEEDMKKKERELNNEQAELRIREERIVEREERIHTREQKLNRRHAELEEREIISREETERLLKVKKSHEEDARRTGEEAQKLREEAQNLKEEARKLMEEAHKSMEEAKAKESEVVKREEVVKNLEVSTKELHARVEQTEKSFEAKEKELKEKDHTLKKKEEDMKKREEDFKKKVTDAKKKDLSLNHRSDDLSNRERTIGNRENEVKKKEEDLANREQNIQSRERDAEMSKYDLEDRATSVAEREREVEIRENSLLQARREIEVQTEELKRQWNELQKREHELLNKMKQKLGDEVPKENETDRDHEKREEEWAYEQERKERERREEERERERREEERVRVKREEERVRVKREESEREEQHIKEQARRMQKEREIQEKVREEQRRHLEEEEERQRASEERRIREEARRREQWEKRQQGIGDEERAKEEERKRLQELREAKEKEEKERIAKEADRDERFKQEQERIRQQREHQRRDSSGPDNFRSSNPASGSNRAPPTRANSTTSHDSRGTSSGPSGWSSSAGSSGWSSSSGASAWSSAKATSASSSASSNARRKPSTNFGAHSSASTSGTEKPKSPEEQNQSAREKFRIEQERQETLRQAKVAIAGRSTGDMMQAYIYHENQWEVVVKHEQLYWDSFPWPMFTLPKDAEQITAGAIWAYLKQDVYLAKDKPASIKDRIKDQIKKWHPDRFETKLLPKVVDNEKEAVKEGAGNVVRCLNDLLEKAPSLMGW